MNFAGPTLEVKKREKGEEEEEVSVLCIGMPYVS